MTLVSWSPWTVFGQEGDESLPPISEESQPADAPLPDLEPLPSLEAEPSTPEAEEATEASDIPDAQQPPPPAPQIESRHGEEDLEAVDTGGFNGGVSAVLVQPNGRVLVAGMFNSYGGVPIARGFARLGPRGQLDRTFTNNTRLTFAKAEMYTLALQSDGRILVGGNFILHGVGNQSWQGLARFSTDGRLDTSFGHVLGDGFDSIVVGMAVQRDDKMIVVGNFSSFGGKNVGGVARLTADGRLDEAFTAAMGSGVGPRATVKSVVVQPDSKIILVGDFEEFSGRKVDGVVRLHSDGSLDQEFQTNIGDSFFVGFPLLDMEDKDSEAGLYLSKVLLQPSGHIVLGGEFISYNSKEEIYSSKVLRLTPDGRLDLDFIKRNLKYKFIGDVNSLLLQHDGKIVVGCTTPFSRLEEDGTHDEPYLRLTGRAFVGDIGALAYQPDGKVIVGGRFNSYKGIKVGNIVRLNPEGTLDETFVSGSAR